MSAARMFGNNRVVFAFSDTPSIGISPSTFEVIISLLGNTTFQLLSLFRTELQIFGTSGKKWDVHPESAIAVNF